MDPMMSMDYMDYMDTSAASTASCWGVLILLVVPA